MTDFAQVTSPVDSIRAILAQYPHGTGLFKELIQNSDDAGASEQVFVLDCRTHRQGTGFAPGPALIAQNNAVVTDSDWEGLQRIQNSAKTRNANTTGKYGLGFRASFHITDTPEILSGSYLATIDPLNHVVNSGGVRRTFVGDRALALHLATFASVLASKKPHRAPYEATAIRLPLRCAAGPESPFGPAMPCEHVRELLEMFIRDEMCTVMLFLRNITSITIRVITADGETSTSAELQKSAPIHMHGAVVRELMVVNQNLGEDSCSRWWHITCGASLKAFARQLATRLGHGSDSTQVERQLEREKYVPEVGIAFPMDARFETGHLYTYLPLAITTGFPFHINGSFALTSDRQSLVNPAESGAAYSEHRVRVEWNKLLFSTAIPAAWCTLLRAGVRRGIDVVNLWPQSEPLNQPHGQATYWNDTPTRVVELIWKHSIPVWPLVQGPYVALSKDILVDVDTHELPAHVRALVDIGLKICRLPSHIMTILRLASVPVNGLSPETAHERLLKHPEQLYSAPLDENGHAMRRIVLDFLLSSRPFLNIIDLPLIPLASDPDVYFALERSANVDGYIFDTSQAYLFGPTDRSPKSISYALASHLPQPFSQLPLLPYNLRRPNAVHIVHLTMQVLAHFGPDHEGKAVPWAVDLWKWVAGLPDSGQATHTAALAQHPVLPTSNGSWCRASPAGVYPFTDEIHSPELRALLERGGLLFLHPTVPLAPLEKQGLVRSIRDAHTLITGGTLQRAMETTTSECEALALIELLADILSTSPLTEKLCSPLRELPIFPIIAAGELSASTERQRIPVGATVYIVPSDLGLPIPEIANVCYVSSSLPRVVARAIGARDAILTQLDVLQLALDNFTSQTTTLQAAVVYRMAKEQESIPRKMINKLAQLRFVPVAEGHLTARPCDVIDPASSLHSLFPADSHHAPQSSGREGRRVVKKLSKLGLLLTQLTPTLANECIERIASDPSNAAHFPCASSLVSMLDATDMDMALLELDDSQRWIPCEGNVLRARVDCRDASEDKHHQRDLFDRVLALSTVSVKSWALRERLNWHRPIPITVIKRQFELCVQDDSVSPATMQSLIGELAGRRSEISASDMDELRGATTGRRWVPVNGELKSEVHVVFDLPIALPPFCRLDARSPAKRSFLLELGCSERPSTQSVLDAIQTLRDATGEDAAVDASRIVSLLKVICLSPLDDTDLSQLLVPTDDLRLCPREQVYYNDMPPQAHSVKLPGFARRAHRDIDAELAGRLRLEPLSKLCIREQYDEEDMGEPLSSRVSNVLVQYQREQMPTEFLANAIDAGATSVSFTIDEVDFSSAIVNLLQPNLMEFQSGGSLVVYNNSRFTQSDWLGIKRVGQGSKRGAAGTIGRFGLGALAAYHISEVTMIISGEFFLILDPSRRYLGDGRASRQIRLEDMRTFYRDQLAPFYGLHGFEENDIFYEGTLFRLPLRTLSQAAKSELCKVPFSTTDARLLLDRYSDSGKLAALFVPSLVSLRVCKRAYLAGAVKALTAPTSLWTLEVARSEKISDAVASPSIQATCVELRILFPTTETTEEWETYTKSLRLSALDQRLADRYRLSETISVGIALRSDTRATSSSSRLFAHLPLPISTSLPVHVHASFIMAEDRRAIRLDETSLEDSESSFNQRLLSTHIPDLYLEALHRFPTSRSLLDESLLPDQRVMSDAPSRLVANGLYSTFAADKRLVCQSVTGARIPPFSVVFADQHVPERVRHVLELLAPANYVLGPSALNYTAIPRVSADFVRETLVDSSPDFQDLFHSRRITIDMVASLVQYLMDDDLLGGRLFGLHLLPLADGTVTPFNPDSWHVFSLPGSLRSVLVGQDAPWHTVFPANRFVHPDMPGSLQDGLLNADNQVKLFDRDAIAQLVHSRLPTLPRHMLSNDDAIWVSAFWELYPLMHPLDVIDDSLSDLPLVPVRGTNWNFISLASCVNPEVFFKSATTPLVALESLQTMGASIMDKPNLPQILRMHESIQSSSFTLPSVLRFLELGAHERFDLLHEPQATEFRTWLKTQLCRLTSLSAQDLAAARTLPLVPVRDTTHFAAPNDVVMLPSFIRLADVLPLTEASYRLASYDADVQRVFQTGTVGVWDLCKVIAARQDLGQVISADALAALRGFLDSVLDIHSVTSHDLSPLKIPNTNGVYVAAEELFVRRVTLFVDIFDVEGRRPDAFVHHELSGLEARMHKLAIKTEIDAEAFGECARTVHNATDPGRVDSAHIMYAFYNDPLTRTVRRVNWEFLEDQCFIPRHPDRRQLRPDFNAYGVDLPLVVSPSQLVLPEYESIAWSQRARVTEPPSRRLLAERPGLGTPTFDDVLAHLHVLQRIGQDHPYDAAVVKDAEASYEYLETNLERLPDEVTQTLRNADIFLNTDGRGTVWQWCSPSSLILNAPDDGEDYKRVRNNLRPHAKLLLHLGTISIVEADAPSIQLSGAEDTLRMLRASFDEKRQAEVAVDVVFVDGDEPPGRHLAHRIFLAACAVHFEMSFFKSDMRESASVNAPLEVRLDYSGDAVERCLDYFYTGTYERVEHKDLEVLFDMLALADYWDIDDFRATIERDLATHLSPNVYEMVRDYAKQYHAENLVRICAQWEERNQAALRRVGSGRTDIHVD